MSVVKYKPRNSWVLVRRVQLGETPSGIQVPDSSIEGVEHVVEAFGHKVEHLAVGDKVLITGQYMKDYAFLPNSKELLLCEEHSIALIYVDE